MKWVKVEYKDIHFYVMKYNIFEKIYYKLHNAYIESIKKGMYYPTPCVKQGGLYINGRKV